MSAHDLPTLKDIQACVDAGLLMFPDRHATQTDREKAEADRKAKHMRYVQDYRSQKALRHQHLTASTG